MQSYQEVSIEVEKELYNLVKIKPQPDPHKFFWNLKQKDPKKFERLRFDTNGHAPYSETLSDILFDCYLSGMFWYDWDNLVMVKNEKEFQHKGKSS